MNAKERLEMAKKDAKLSEEHLEKAKEDEESDHIALAMAFALTSIANSLVAIGLMIPED